MAVVTVVAVMATMAVTVSKRGVGRSCARLDGGRLLAGQSRHDGFALPSCAASEPSRAVEGVAGIVICLRRLPCPAGDGRR